MSEPAARVDDPLTVKKGEFIQEILYNSLYYTIPL